MVSFKSKKREQAETEQAARSSKPPVEQDAPVDSESSHPPPEAAAPAAEEPKQEQEQEQEQEQATDEDVEDAKQDKEAATASDEDEQQDEQPPAVEHAKMVMPAQLPNFRVTADWKGSINGSMCSLAKGKLIKPRLYGGLVGIERLRQAGVALRRM